MMCHKNAWRLASAIVCLTVGVGVSGCSFLKKREAYLHGKEAYAYGFPLVVMDVTRQVQTATPTAGEYTAPINQFARMQRYVSPDFKNVVRISMSSLWTTGFVDLEQEPFVVSLPDTHGRYVVMQALNMWTDDFASVGKRTTGTGPGNFLIAGPNWNGTAPIDVKGIHRSSTRYAWILIQTQTDGPRDFADVIALEAQYKLTPLSAWGKAYTPPDNVPVDQSVDTKMPPVDQVKRMDAGAFFKRLALLMKDNPPYPADAPMMEKLKKLGIEPGQDFDFGKLDPAVAAGLNRAVRETWRKIESAPYKMETLNGWANPLTLGAYGTDYATRAVIAWLGLGALTKEDAVYPTAFEDSDGNRLDFAKKYAMHVRKDQMFPCNATWSLSIYQGNFYAPNAINRYDLAPWMPLKYNADGSLDLVIQPASPGMGKESNWLPSPPGGPMNLTLRCYWPKEPFLNGTYKLPPLERVQ